MTGQYWVTGADGREYGPVPLDTLARWIREGRVAAATLVRKEDRPAAEARSLPELAGFFASAAAAPPPGAPALPPVAARSGAKVPADFRVWDLIERAWDIVRPHWLTLAGIFFISTAIGFVPYVGWCVQFIVGGAIMVGIWRAVLGMIDGRPPEVGMMFEGFDRFGDAFLAYLLRSILVGIGLCFLIIPGIVLAILWAFTFPVLAETRLGFWEAMRRSAILTEGYRWPLFLLALACIPILLLGLLAACVGIFVALPVCVTAFGLAYRFLLARRSPSARPA